MDYTQLRVSTAIRESPKFAETVVMECAKVGLTLTCIRVNMLGVYK